MVTIRALKTTVGEYGKLRKDQTASVRPSVAKSLEKSGIAEILTEDDGKEPGPQSKGFSITIREGDKTILDTNDDRKIIKKEKVITPEEPEPAIIGVDLATGPDKTVVAVIKDGKVTELFDVDGKELDTSKDQSKEPIKKDESDAEGKAEQGHQQKVDQKETPKKNYNRK